MTWPAPMRLVRVRWRDSHSAHGWQTAAKWSGDIDGWLADTDDLMCLTVGWLFRETADSIFVFQSMNAQTQLEHMMQIPRSVICEIVDLVADTVAAGM